MELICYNKCSTCQKAKKYLDERNINYSLRDIKTNNPTKDELKLLASKANKELQQFFNTSGKKYRELNLKDKIKMMSEDEMLDLLSQDGLLVKRPILVNGDQVLVGFKIAEWDRINF